MIHTEICDLLGIQHPILLAGMAGVSFAGLTAAVSEAGGMGILGGANLDPGALRREIRKTRSLTGKPFGVDLLMAVPEMVQEQVKVIFEEKIPVFVSGLAVPEGLIERAKKEGMKVISMIGKVAHALRAEAAGVDVIVAQGTEAGGHTGRIGTFALVPQVVDAVKIPVLAAGAIADGRGLVAALALGAKGVVMGTRFVASPEARAAETYQNRILQARDEDTVVTKCYTGKTLRAIRNSYTDEWERKADQVKPFPFQALASIENNVLSFVTDGEIRDATRECLPCGQVCGMIKEVRGAGEIVQQVIREAEEIMERRR
jgi:enoyl-[acyl-carrier protein] reductase II